MSTDLAIKDVAERTGIAAGTIRMWEQRYGFPAPERTSSGYRRYTEDDVDALRKVLALRHRGLSVPAAISRAQDTGGASDHPSIYAAVAAQDATARPLILKKATLAALSKAIEHEALALAAAPIVFGGLPAGALLPAASSAATGASRSMPTRPRSSPTSPAACAIPTARRPRSRSAATTPWATSGPSSSTRPATRPACWPGSSPASPSRAAPTIPTAASRRSGRSTRRRPVAPRRSPPGWWGAPTRRSASGCRSCSTDRPLALEEPAPALTALTNRMIAYLEAADGA